LKALAPLKKFRGISRHASALAIFWILFGGVSLFAQLYNLGAFWRLSGVTGYTLVCDSGTPATTCTISTVHVIPSNVNVNNVTGNLVVASGGNLKNISNAQSFTLTVGGDITIQSGGTIQAAQQFNRQISHSIREEQSTLTDSVSPEALPETMLA